MCFFGNEWNTHPIALLVFDVPSYAPYTELDMDWIHPRFGLDWVGWLWPPFLNNSNHCSTIDAVSFKESFLPRLRNIGIVSGAYIVNEFDLIPDIYDIGLDPRPRGLDWLGSAKTGNVQLCPIPQFREVYSIRQCGRYVHRIEMHRSFHTR